MLMLQKIINDNAYALEIINDNDIHFEICWVIVFQLLLLMLLGIDVNRKRLLCLVEVSELYLFW